MCGKGFTRRENVQRHKYRAHINPKYTCDGRGRFIAYFDALMVHKETQARCAIKASTNNLESLFFSSSALKRSDLNFTVGHTKQSRKHHTPPSSSFSKHNHTDSPYINRPNGQGLRRDSESSTLENLPFDVQSV